MPTPITRFSRFTRATDDMRFRVIATSAGEPGSGKTSFWLNAPAPIVFLSFDGGLEKIVADHLRENPGREIYVATYDLGLIPTLEDESEIPVYSQDMAIELREKVLKDYNTAIRDGARTIVLDREDNFWAECTYAEFGDPRTGNPKDWGALKDVERRMVATAKASDISLGLIQGLKNEWVSQVNKKTGAKGITQSGRRVSAGHDEAEYLVFHNLYHARTTQLNLHGEKEVNFDIHVGKSHERSIQEQDFQNVSFLEMAQLMFPTSTEEDWQDTV